MSSMECGCSCGYDYEPASVYNVTEPRARKDHKCCECGGQIQPGEKYEYVWGVGTDGAFTAKTCLTCARIAKDYCCNHGTLRETIWEITGVDYVTGETWSDGEDES